MNCQSFEIIARDLARNSLFEADSLRECLKHADECSACAERLRDERLLSSSLRGIATGDVYLQASPAAEEALLAAFRSAHANTPTVANVTMFPAAKRRFHWSVAAAAAA